MSRSPVDTAYAIVRQAAARERLDRLVAETRAHVHHTPDCTPLPVVLDLTDAPPLENVWLALEALRRLANTEGGPR